MIIDEEQRFGVKHKEQIKELKNNVDVMTLTATPIPRNSSYEPYWNKRYVRNGRTASGTVCQYRLLLWNTMRKLQGMP